MIIFQNSIDKRNYESDEDIYNLIKNMKDSEVLEYQHNINNFLKSDKIYSFMPSG